MNSSMEGQIVNYSCVYIILFLLHVLVFVESHHQSKNTKKDNLNIIHFKDTPAQS